MIMKRVKSSMQLLVGASALMSTGIYVEAFAPTRLDAASPSKHFASTNVLVHLSSTNADSNDDQFDYEELQNSNVEKNRMTSMYSHFGHNEWLVHRASDRFYRNVLDFNKSPIVESLLDEVALLVAISLGIILWNGLGVEGYTDLSGMHHDPVFNAGIKLSLPMEPFLLCGGPLGLLLVFRNDASFGRYNEALHHWEKIVSDFQNMLLMASNAAPQLPENIQALGLSSWALVRTLQHEVSGNFDPYSTYEKDIRKKLGPKQADQLLSAKNKLYRAQYDIHQAIEPFTDHITVLDKRTLINTVNDVALQCVECERLYTTPIPLLYTRHTLKFLTFWMSLMPFALYNVFEESWNHLALVPAISILTFLFFGIEEIAVSLEEPFSILPLDELVEDVEVAMNEVTEWIENDVAVGTGAAMKKEEGVTQEASLPKM